MHQSHIIFSFNSSIVIITIICIDKRKQKKDLLGKKIKSKKTHLDRYQESEDWNAEQVKFKSMQPLQSQTSSRKYAMRSSGSHFGLHQKAQGKGVHTTFNLLKRNQSAQVMCKCGMKGSPMIYFT
jgi:hypothetical protein